MILLVVSWPVVDGSEIDGVLEGEGQTIKPVDWSIVMPGGLVSRVKKMGSLLGSIASAS